MRDIAQRNAWLRPAWRALLCFALAATLAAMAAPPRGQSPVDRQVTILYTNDFHSAFDPIPAYWLPGEPRIGGAAHLATLINQIRAREEAVFLFDTGDMFTGMISFLTRGEALMEMMRAMRYDAMAIGNHEFDYGSENFSRQMYRVPYPILGANIFYKGTAHPYSRPYVILERGGVRLGVVGIIGQDARSVALPSGITNLDFHDPIPIVRALVRELRPQVDLVVVLAHQGKTGPMQTDAEAHADLQRDFDEDVRLCGEVEGIDVFVGGHAHRGIEKPFVHPRTGTLIVQTYGYGTRLGYLKLRLRGGKIAAHEGQLLQVRSDQLPPDPETAATVKHYQQLDAPEIGEIVGRARVRLTRDYRAESLLGAFVADVMRELAKTDIAITNAGGLRADLPRGEVNKGHVLDALPFVNSVVVCEMTGAQIKEVLEQGFTLERGMVQVSGLRARYDLRKPKGQRLLSLDINGRAVEDSKMYRVATNSFLGQGGDLYATFLRLQQQDTGQLLSAVVLDYFRRVRDVAPPQMGRLIPVGEARPKMNWDIQ
jgi:2',3'-cyclic-nucleotide 2'-phosphodiesterase (5'-nucleotidase family)